MELFNLLTFTKDSEIDKEMFSSGVMRYTLSQNSTWFTTSCIGNDNMIIMIIMIIICTIIFPEKLHSWFWSLIMLSFDFSHRFVAMVYHVRHTYQTGIAIQIFITVSLKNWSNLYNIFHISRDFALHHILHAYYTNFLMLHHVIIACHYYLIT